MRWPQGIAITPPRLFAELAETPGLMGRWANRQWARRRGWWHRASQPRQSESGTAPAARPETSEPPDTAVELATAAVATAAGPVHLVTDGAVATVTLHRPERRNAIDLATWQALADTAAALAQDHTVRVIVLTGAGATFSAGSDISEFPTARLGVDAARHYNEVYESALAAWADLPQPVVAAITGYCLGAALELALTADFRIAASDAIFGIPATRLGIGISVADARRLIDVVGPARARALLLSGQRLSAKRALAIGLVDDIVASKALDGRIDAQVRMLLENAPQSMAWVKRAIAYSLRHPDADPIGFDVLGTQVFGTRDCAEGVASFLARRPPHFAGE